eukprot:Gb_07665 [translate_table: standard]
MAAVFSWMHGCSSYLFLGPSTFHSSKQEWQIHSTHTTNFMKYILHKRRINPNTRSSAKNLMLAVPGTVGNLREKRRMFGFVEKVKWTGPESVFQTQEKCLAVPRMQCNAGAAELGGSGVGYVEEMDQQRVDGVGYVEEMDQQRVDETMKKKKKRKKIIVAGVDQDELVDPLMLADSDSRFVDFNGVQVHHKLADSCMEDLTKSSDNEVSILGTENWDNGLSEKEIQSSPPIGIPAILLHGFGASAFSWDRVLKPLAKLVGSKVVAFDRPAFGLTSRTQLPLSNVDENGKLPDTNPYSLGFSIAATLSFIDILHSQKAILIGHSAGCLVAANAYFEAPERVAALILVAPAILAPLAYGKDAKQKQRDKVAGNSSPEVQENPFGKIRRILSRAWIAISRLVMNMLQRMSAMANALYRKILSAIFRSDFAVMLVRFIMDKYGREAVRYAWYDSKNVTDHIIQGYTKPLKCRGWERALLEFTLAMITDSASEGKPPLQKRLKDISCPVLVVTGDTDRLVPAWNAERLAKAIPGSKFEVIQNCGHLPQEEKPEEFLVVVQRFLQWAVGTSEKQVLQAAA